MLSPLSPPTPTRIPPFPPQPQPLSPAPQVKTSDLCWEMILIGTVPVVLQNDPGTHLKPQEPRSSNGLKLIHELAPKAVGDHCSDKHVIATGHEMSLFIYIYLYLIPVNGCATVGSPWPTWEATNLASKIIWMWSCIGLPGIEVESGLEWRVASQLRVFHAISSTEAQRISTGHLL